MVLLFFDQQYNNLELLNWVILVSLGHPQLDHLDMEMVTDSLATLGKFTFAAISQIICTFVIVT